MLNFKRLVAVSVLALGAHSVNAQSSHIIILDLATEHEPHVISEQNFYSNQPLITEQGVFYSQDVDGQTDIFLYQYGSGESVNLTNTPKRSEYSPTLTPKQDFISSVVVEADGTQRLWRYSTQGEAVAAIDIEQTVVGYHAWGKSEQELLLFALGEPHYALYRTPQQQLKLVDNPGRTLTYRTQQASFSFTQNISDNELGLYQYTPGDSDYSLIMTMPASAVDHTWFSEDSVLFGSGAEVFELRANAEPKRKFDLSQHCDGEITRLNYNARLQRLAVVCNTADN